MSPPDRARNKSNQNEQITRLGYNHWRFIVVLRPPLAPWLPLHNDRIYLAQDPVIASIACVHLNTPEHGGGISRECELAHCGHFHLSCKRIISSSNSDVSTGTTRIDKLTTLVRVQLYSKVLLNNNVGSQPVNDSLDSHQL